jgi:hypothetical protein
MSTIKISEGIEQAIRDPSLQATAANLAELALDTVIDEGVLRDIPVLGSLLGIGRAAVSIRDHLFINKLAHMLVEIDRIPHSERVEMIDEINQSKDYSIKVGEKLLYIIDRCEDHNTTSIVGMLFAAYLEGNMDYGYFLRAATVVDRMHLDDFIEFTLSDWENIPAEDSSAFLSAGLATLDPLYIKVENQWDHKSTDPYIVEGGDLTASITQLGREIRSVLSERLKTPNPEVTN